MHEVLLEQFIASFKKPPKELILDFDATDDPVHGNQEGRFFHGYYDRYCFLPHYVFCGSQLLVAYLRPSNVDAARHSWAILKLLVSRLRKRWPQVRIIFRGDSGFCRWKMLRWCEGHEVGYIMGLAKNRRLLKMAQELLDKATEEHQRTGAKFAVWRIEPVATNGGPTSSTSCSVPSVFICVHLWFLPTLAGNAG